VHPGVFFGPVPYGVFCFAEFLADFFEKFPGGIYEGFGVVDDVGVAVEGLWISSNGQWTIGEGIFFTLCASP
jgi:hypothetical protein